MSHIWECIQKFPDCPPGARPSNDTALCHYVQLYHYFVSQSSEFCRHNPLFCFSTSVYCCCLFRYWLSPETFGYTLVLSSTFCCQITSIHFRFNWIKMLQFLFTFSAWRLLYVTCRNKSGSATGYQTWIFVLPLKLVLIYHCLLFSYSVNVCEISIVQVYE
jgi:hypothetical protein